MSTKFFTIDEINALIPILEFKLPKLLQIKGELASFITSLVKRGIKVEELLGMNQEVDEEFLKLKANLEKLGMLLQGELADIQKIGCIVKDMDMGLIDFPGIREGEEVLYCWQLGEKKVLYWHGINEDFSSRKALFEEEKEKTEMQYH